VGVCKSTILLWGDSRDAGIAVQTLRLPDVKLKQVAMNIKVFKFYILKVQPVRLEEIGTHWPMGNSGIILNLSY
jgi:hypothetical protein